MIKLTQLDDAYSRLVLGEMQDMSKEKPKFTPKPDTGTLFKNGYKSNESHPDFVGNYATSDGTIREFAAWLNGDYISVRFSDEYVRKTG